MAAAWTLLPCLWTAAAETEAGEGAELDRRAVERILHPPLGLPPVPVPAGNPPTAAKVRLGRKLFLDRRLSANGTLSCAMCHVPEQGFTVHELQTAVGNEGKSRSTAGVSAATAGP